MCCVCVEGMSGLVWINRTKWRWTSTSLTSTFFLNKTSEKKKYKIKMDSGQRGRSRALWKAWRSRQDSPEKCEAFAVFLRTLRQYVFNKRSPTQRRFQQRKCPSLRLCQLHFVDVWVSFVLESRDWETRVSSEKFLLCVASFCDLPSWNSDFPTSEDKWNAP